MPAAASGDEQSGRPGRARQHRRAWIWVAAGVLVVAVAGFVLWSTVGVEEFHSAVARPVPSFPSLADTPDLSLGGTVAYFDNGSRCVRIIAASGAVSEDVYCLTDDDLALSPQEGKPAGPQLVWAPDGRLEVTLFRWVPSKDETSAPPMAAQWQKLIDVTTGEVQQVPDDQLPDAPLEPTPSTVNQRGEELRTDFDALTGRGEVTLTTGSGTRALLTVRGPGEYTYGLEPASWSPDGEWIVTTDTGEGGRILVITPTDPAVTRVLVADSGGGAGGGTAGPAYAVTSADLLGENP
jgi:hypothetical protein